MSRKWLVFWLFLFGIGAIGEVQDFGLLIGVPLTFFGAIGYVLIYDWFLRRKAARILSRLDRGKISTATLLARMCREVRDER